MNVESGTLKGSGRPPSDLRLQKEGGEKVREILRIEETGERLHKGHFTCTRGSFYETHPKKKKKQKKEEIQE